MNLTYKLLQTELDTIPLKLYQEADATMEGKKFSFLILKKLSGYVGEKLIKSYTDGGGDHQVDGVFFNEENELQINIATCKFTQKDDDPIKDKDITDFIKHGLEYLIFGEDGGMSFNSKIRDMKDEIDELRKEYKEKFSICLKFISTSETVLSHNGRNMVDKFLSKLQPLGISATFELYNGRKLSSIFSNRYTPNNLIPVKLSGKSYYPLTTKEGFICRLPVSELIKIYKGFKDGDIEYQGYHEYLFTDNVRRSLGLEKKINEHIYSTATDPNSAPYFEYYNNGLTIIYDQKSGNLIQDSPVIYMKGMQVVNGCQTVSTLIEAHENNELCEEIYLTARFIKRDDENNFITSVITYTNSQNAITDRDLHSNDEIQYEIQSILKKLGIYYERKLNEYKDEADEYRLDALEAAQAYLCCEMRQPHTAKQKKKKLFNEFYTEVFKKADIDLPYKLLLSFYVLEYTLKCQSKHRRKKNRTKKLGKSPRFSIRDMIIVHGTYHIASILYHSAFLKAERSDLYKLAKDALTNNNFYPKLEAKYEKIIDRIEEILRKNNIDKASVRNYLVKTGLEKVSV